MYTPDGPPAPPPRETSCSPGPSPPTSRDQPLRPPTSNTSSSAGDSPSRRRFTVCAPVELIDSDSLCELAGVWEYTGGFTLIGAVDSTTGAVAGPCGVSNIANGLA